MLVDDEENVTVIDFPQMISTNHINAEYYFDRDVTCVRNFFKRRYEEGPNPRPQLSLRPCSNRGRTLLTVA